MSAKAMTIDEAMAIAAADDCTAEQWATAERALIRARLCPHCACDGFKQQLGRLQESTADTYAGRECPSCEEFIPDFGQDHRCGFMRADEPDTDATGMCFSDADPGL